MSSLLTRRLGAYLADCTLVLAVCGPLGVVVQSMLGLYPQIETGGVYAMLLLTMSIPTWTYVTLADAPAGGATLGKRLLGLRVSRGDGRRLSISNALARTAVKLAPWEMVHVAFFLAPALDVPAPAGWGLAGLAYAVLAVTLRLAWTSGGRRALHDRIAATTVVPVPDRQRATA